MAAVGDTVQKVWNLSSLVSGGAYTGLSGTMTATLKRISSGTAVDASETVTVDEIGSTGYYTFSFSPENNATYLLHVVESTYGFEVSFQEEVAASTASGAADNAYCTEADVRSWAQLGDYTASTKPTETEVLGFMENRAGEIYGLMYEVVDDAAPGPTGYNTTIDTTSDKGYALSRFLKMANAIGAAIDALEAAGASEEPRRSERVNELFGMYQALLERIKGVVRGYVGFGNRARTHLSQVGQWTPESGLDEPGLTITGSEDF